MKKIRRTAHITEGITTSSQSDIAFLLIIFFMVAAVFTTQEGLDIFLPKSDADPRTIPSENLLILSVDESGVMMLNDIPIAVNEIYSRVNKEKTENPMVVVLTKIDCNCPYGFVISAVNELQRVHDLRISFKTTGSVQ